MRQIAYFSMEIAVDPAMPTYSGGLGVLAGDVCRTAADMRLPMVAVTLLHRKGYFSQRIGADGWQQERPVEWEAEKHLQEMKQRASVELGGRTVYIRAWRYDVEGRDGFRVPVYFLDTDLPENEESDRTLTHYLYGGDARYRLCQEAIFGVGGVRMLRVLGYEGLTQFHMNEGHASLLTLALLDGEARKAGKRFFTQEEVEAVRKKCVFTTHTPVAAGHDRFSMDVVDQVLDRREISVMKELFCRDGQLDLTHIALNFSHYVNAVSNRHGEVCKTLFCREVEVITNGVHASTWAAPSFQALYDRYLPRWRRDNFRLRYAQVIPREEIWQAHLAAKRELMEAVAKAAGVRLKEEAFTLGFARRAAAYKRASLLFEDPERLKAIASEKGPLQILYAGKAHPHDEEGKRMIKRVCEARDLLGGEIPVVYLENYDMHWGRLLTSGCDLWLNTPLPPLEASGTSGMKAALNGVPSLSTLDGWWAEGHLEGVTGWAIGDGQAPAGEVSEELTGDRTRSDAQALYAKLQWVVLPLFRDRRDDYIEVMRQAIALNGSFFNTQRMMRRYVVDAYFLAG